MTHNPTTPAPTEEWIDCIKTALKSASKLSTSQNCPDEHHEVVVNAMDGLKALSTLTTAIHDAKAELERAWNHAKMMAKVADNHKAHAYSLQSDLLAARERVAELENVIKIQDGEIQKDVERESTYTSRALTAEARCAELLNLLAIIHRDGGHYTEQHGITKSINDAHRVWGDLVAQRDRMKAALIESSKLLAFLHGAFGDKLKPHDKQRLTSAHDANRAALSTPPAEEKP